jgi:hypothetical protein
MSYNLYSSVRINYNFHFLCSTVLICWMWRMKWKLMIWRWRESWRHMKLRLLKKIVVLWIFLSKIFMILMLSFVSIELRKGELKRLKNLGWFFEASSAIISRFSNLFDYVFKKPGGKYLHSFLSMMNYLKFFHLILYLSSLTHWGTDLSFSIADKEWRYRSVFDLRR